MAIKTTQEEVLPLGSKLPTREYKSANKNMEIGMDSSKYLMLIFFSRNCEHCKYQLGLFEKNIEMLDRMDLLFLSSDDGYQEDATKADWKKLFDTQRTNVKLGFVDNEVAKNLFGIAIKPTIFVFYKNTLIDKIYGETKFDRLIKSINMSDVPEHQSDGNN